MVAGELISRVSGMSWEDFITNHILKPLEMNDSYSSLDDVQNIGMLAAPHVETKGTLRPISHFSDRINGAAGGIYASVEDLSKWMLVHLNHGKYGKYGEDLEHQLFSEENQREMWKIHTTLDPPRTSRYTSHFSGYGLERLRYS